MQQRRVYSTFWSQLEKKNNIGCAEKKEKETKELLYEIWRIAELFSITANEVPAVFNLHSMLKGLWILDHHTYSI